MSSNITPHRALVSPEQRAALKGQTPCVLWFTGLSGAGKSTLSTLVDAALHSRGYHTFVLDGDNMRRRLCCDLGFSVADRTENIRRVAETARLMTEAGLITLTAFISPFRAERSLARSLFAPGRFIEIYVNAPLELVEQRDPKGLYRRARRGEIRDFTGIDSPYEAPEHPELVLDTARFSPECCVQTVLAYLEKKGFLHMSTTTALPEAPYAASAPGLPDAGSTARYRHHATAQSQP